VISIQPNYEIDPSIDISNHRALSKKSDNSEKLLILTDVSRNSDFHLFLCYFFATGTVFAILKDLQPCALAELQQRICKCDLLIMVAIGHTEPRNGVLK